MSTAQPSGPVDRSYEKIIPFRQLEFSNAFLEWIIMDDIKLKKAALYRLRRAFRIVNAQSINALLRSPCTIATWIEDMHIYFEPMIIKEIKNT